MTYPTSKFRYSPEGRAFGATRAELNLTNPAAGFSISSVKAKITVKYALSKTVLNDQATEIMGWEFTPVEPCPPEARGVRVLVDNIII